MPTERAVRLELLTFPTELLLRIYELLPSFADIFALGATCHTLRNVWKQHRTAIVKEITDQFECYPYARELLAFQRNGAPLEQSDLSDRCLAKLAHNARRIDQAIETIEQNHIPGLQGTSS